MIDKLYHIFSATDRNGGELNYRLNLTERDVIKALLTNNDNFDSIIYTYLHCDNEVETEKEVQSALEDFLSMSDSELDNYIGNFLDFRYATHVWDTGYTTPEIFFTDDNGKLERYYPSKESIRQVVREEAISY